MTPAFEPEPGMLVETAAEWAALGMDATSLSLALDAGHEALSPAARTRKADACAACASQCGGEAAMRERVQAQATELCAVACA